MLSAAANSHSVIPQHIEEDLNLGEEALFLDFEFGTGRFNFGLNRIQSVQNQILPS